MQSGGRSGGGEGGGGGEGADRPLALELAPELLLPLPLPPPPPSPPLPPLRRRRFKELSAGRCCSARPPMLPVPWGEGDATGRERERRPEVLFRKGSCPALPSGGVKGLEKGPQIYSRKNSVGPAVAIM